MSGLDTSAVTSMNGMFYDCENLEELDVSMLDTGNVTDMEDMFAGCSKLESLDISQFDMKNVTTMDGMFWRCDKLKKVVFDKLDTSSVTKWKKVRLYQRKVFIKMREMINIIEKLIHRLRHVLFLKGCQMLT